MNFSVFIKYPYVAMVIAIVITLTGILAVFSLPVTQYPDVTPPQVVISANYPGADALTILQTVIAPIEEQVNGARNMIYLDSSSSNSGEAVLTASFEIGSDGERDTQLIQSRVDWASPQLPQAVQKEGLTVKEQSGNILLAITLYSPERTYDSLFMSNYASINLTQKLKRIPGVAEVMIFGSSDYGMRLWLKPDRMAGMGIAVPEVLSSLQSQNVQVSSGSIGASPASSSQKHQYNIQTRGRLLSAEEFGNIIVRSAANGAQVKMSDIADIKLGAELYNSASLLNGQPAIVLLVFQLANGNAIAISENCRELMAQQSATFPPGLRYGFQYDSSLFIRASIGDVAKTFALAILLVSLVTLLFLQNWRMVLVPTLAIPVSIVGTFAVLHLLGYSINLVTLFGMILAIGIVVDDAIIVIENVSRLMTEEHLSPREAAEKSMRQISGVIIATTLVLLAMFVPICFMKGITGELYRQFGITLSVAVLLSALNALTLSPALSALLLRPEKQRESSFFFFRWFNRFFASMNRGYGVILGRILKVAVVVMLLYAGFIGFSFYRYSKLPGGFIPEEDQGVFFCSLQLPQGASLERTKQMAEELSMLLRHVPGVADVIAMPGFNILKNLPASDNAFVIVTLDPWKERLAKRLPLTQIMMECEMLGMEKMPEALLLPFVPPAIPGIGTAGGFNFVLQDYTGTDIDRLADVTMEMMMAAMKRPELRNVFSIFNADSPYLFLKIDRAKALELGVSMNAVDQVLENMLGFNYVNDFNRFGQVYKVELQSGIAGRNTVDSIRNLYVPNRNGKMVPMASIADISTKSGAEFLNRYNTYLASQIQGSAAPGYSSGEAMSVMEELAGKILPPGMGYQWTDMSYQQQQAGNKLWMVFLVATVFIYLFLAALYGSWVLPFSVILAIPPAMYGAVVLLEGLGMDNNIYTQIGMVLLFGMACKTAILIVDFAKNEHMAGTPLGEAAMIGAKRRFRAVLMTAFAFILGTLPLAFSVGPGAASQRSIGVTVVGGMILAIGGGLLLVPLFYVLAQKLLERNKS